jgi:hypothetical protein
MTPPSITAIVVAPEGADWRRSVASLSAQTLRPDEIVVVAEATPDPLPVGAASSASRIEMVAAGTPPTEMVNTAIALSRGDLVVLNMAGDISSPDRIEKTVALWQATRAPVIVGAITGSTRQAPREPSLRDFCRRGGTMCCTATALAWHRSIFDGFGRLDGRKSPNRFETIIALRGLLLGGNAYLDAPVVATGRDEADAAIMVGIDNDRKAEALLAGQVEQLLYALETLARFRRQNPQRADLVDCEAMLAAATIGRIGEWTRLRNRLMLFGYRAGWSHRRPLEEAARHYSDAVGF